VGVNMVKELSWLFAPHRLMSYPKFMKRERTSLWVMAYRVYVYFSSPSLRKASRIL